MPSASPEYFDMHTITPATLSDIPELCMLLAILFEQEADFRPDAVKQTAGLLRIIGKPDTGRILALREDGNIVGMVNLMFTVSTACGGRVALLEDMIIDPARRGDGLGGKLLDAAIELARDEGCLRITLLTDRANDAAIRFYQRRGFGISEMLPLRLMLYDEQE